MRFFALHFLALQFLALHFLALHFLALHFLALHLLASHFLALPPSLPPFLPPSPIPSKLDRQPNSQTQVELKNELISSMPLHYLKSSLGFAQQLIASQAPVYTDKDSTLRLLSLGILSSAIVFQFDKRLLFANSP